VATVSIVFVRHEGDIRSIETDRLLRHPAHPCNTLPCGHITTSPMVRHRWSNGLWGWCDARPVAQIRSGFRTGGRRSDGSLVHMGAPLPGHASSITELPYTVIREAFSYSARRIWLPSFRRVLAVTLQLVDVPDQQHPPLTGCGKRAVLGRPVMILSAGGESGRRKGSQLS
jgi:hypothetical protein